MINDIQRQAAVRVSADAMASSLPTAPAIDTKPMAKVELHVPSKPQIQVNTEEMAQNLRHAIDQINTVLHDGGRGVNFVLDQTLNGPIIQVRRAETGEVIRQIPNEVVVRVAHNLEKLQGLLFSSAA